MSTRDSRNATRRAAILEAAFDEFIEKGYAAARVEDVAARAKIAKGTIYLYFSGKQALFEGMVREILQHEYQRVDALVARGDIDARQLIVSLLPTGEAIATSRPASLIRLLLAESLRTPAVAEFYYKEVLNPTFGLLRKLMQRAADDGQLANPDIVRFPQLLKAPIIMAVIWHGLFERFESLDIDAMLETFYAGIFVAKE